MNSWFRTQDVSEELITLSYESRSIAWKTISLVVHARLYTRNEQQYSEVRA